MCKFFLSSSLTCNFFRCQDFTETADVIAKVAFKMYLNITPTVTKWSPASDEFSLMLDHNPLVEFVELPEDRRRDLCYSNVISGAITGALRMLQMEVTCR